jgi:alkylation response protein AidB-like acyl-CoA dehydrogenase
LEPGGADLPLPEQVVLADELSRADALRLALYQVAIFNAAPAILEHATGERKRRFIPGIRNGDVVPGFSEPGACADLAAFSTRAKRNGDVYALKGQKVRTSWVMHAEWCFILVRTDASAPQRRGVRFRLMDMKSPGIEVRSIKQAAGAAEFCELFLADVKVPVANLLGAENDGWRSPKPRSPRNGA